MKMNNFLLVFVLLVLASFLESTQGYTRKKERRDDIGKERKEVQFTQRTDYTVEHCLSLPNEAEIWNERGRLIIDHTSKSGSLSLHEWTEDEIEQWEELSRVNGFYKLRMKIDDSDGYYLNNTLFSSLKACSLTGRSEEKMRLHCDFNGHLTGFDYYSTNTQSGLSCKKSKQLPKTFSKQTEVSISFGNQGESPFTPEYESNPKPKEEASFWSKYWWIILIVGFMLVSQMAQGAVPQ